MRGSTSPGVQAADGSRVPAYTVAVVALTAAGLALRLFWVLYTDTIPLGGDPHWYVVVGMNLADGYGYVVDRNEIFEVRGPGEATAFWPPGYPFLLAGLFKAAGDSITAAKVMNAVLGAAAIPLVFLLGARTFNRGVGAGAAAMFALFPNLIAWTPILFPEPLFTVCLLGALVLVVSLPSSGRARWASLAGVGLLAGLATLTRGQGIVLLPIAATYWLMTSSWQSTARATGVVALVAAITIAPWTVRNAAQMHAFIPISTNSATVLRIGHSPDSTGNTDWTSDEVDGVPMLASLYHTDTETKGYKVYTRRAIGYAVSHPRDEVVLAGKKTYHVYRSEDGIVSWLETLGATPLKPEGIDESLRRLFEYSYYVAFFAAVGSIPLWLRRDPKRLLLINVVTWWTLFHVVFAGDPRYHVPLYPIYFISIAAGLAALAQYASQFSRRAHRGLDTAPLAIEDAPAS